MDRRLSGLPGQGGPPNATHDCGRALHAAPGYSAFRTKAAGHHTLASGARGLSALVRGRAAGRVDREQPGEVSESRAWTARVRLAQWPCRPQRARWVQPAAYGVEIGRAHV